MASRPCANVRLRTFLLAMEEVLGEGGAAAMLNAAGLRQHVQIRPTHGSARDSARRV